MDPNAYDESEQNDKANKVLLSLETLHVLSHTISTEGSLEGGSRRSLETDSYIALPLEDQPRCRPYNSPTVASWPQLCMCPCGSYPCLVGVG